MTTTKFDTKEVENLDKDGTESETSSSGSEKIDGEGLLAVRDI